MELKAAPQPEPGANDTEGTQVRLPAPHAPPSCAQEGGRRGGATGVSHALLLPAPPPGPRGLRRCLAAAGSPPVGATRPGRMCRRPAAGGQTPRVWSGGSRRPGGKPPLGGGGPRLCEGGREGGWAALAAALGAFPARGNGAVR